MRPRSFGGEAALSVEARYLEPELPDELDDAYAQTFDRLRRMFRARGCSAEESADLAQEAAIRAFMHIRRWGVNGAGLDPLLNRIARNLLIDRYRRAVPHIVPLDSADDIHDPSQDPSEEVARRQRRRAVQSAIRSLPTRHAKAITYSLSGLTPEEVGKELGIGRNAADALLHRARRSLREHLAPVREGMWGLALGIKIRFDRVTRAVDARLSDGSIAAIASSATGAAAAALVTVLTVTGATGAAAPAYAGTGEGTTIQTKALVLEGASNGSSLGAGSGSAPTGGGTAGTYAVFGGFARGSYNDSGSDNHVTLRGPGDSQDTPMLDINYKLWKQTQPTADTGRALTERICKKIECGR